MEKLLLVGGVQNSTQVQRNAAQQETEDLPANTAVVLYSICDDRSDHRQETEAQCQCAGQGF